LKYPDFKPDWKDIESRLSTRTKLMLINSPHNPTGGILDENDWLQLERLLAPSNAFLLSDEVYEHIIFDGNKHLSAACSASLRDRSFVVSSFGKSFHTTGWKVGYILAPEQLSSEVRKIHQFVTFATSTPFQYAMAAYMNSGDRFSGLRTFYQEKRDLFRSLIKNSRFDILPCLGSYFQNLGYSKISSESDLDFAKRLVSENKIASVPLSPFYHNLKDEKVLRFCFAKTSETLERAAEILNRI
jgi:methionine aminotransferase